MTVTRVAIPRRVPRRFPLEARPPSGHSVAAVAIPRRVPRRFPRRGRRDPAGRGRGVAIPRRVPRRFPRATSVFTSRLRDSQSPKGPSPISIGDRCEVRQVASQSPEGSLADFHSEIEIWAKCAQVASQSPEGSLADFHRGCRPQDRAVTNNVAIPRRVPRRFPPGNVGATRARALKSQSPEGSLADFHSTPLKSLGLSGLRGHFR